MKKHILGAAIFGVIFTSFAFVFALFYTPEIPQIREVEVEINRKEPVINLHKTSCFLKSRKKISVEVVNSHYFFDEDKIYSKIKLAWNGSGAPPEKIYLTTMVSTSEDKVGNSFDGVFQILEEPFKDAREKTFKVVSRGFNNKKNKKQDNLYLVAAASEHSGGETKEANKSFSESKEILFVHGETSIIGK